MRNLARKYFIVISSAFFTSYLLTTAFILFFEKESHKEYVLSIQNHLHKMIFHDDFSCYKYNTDNLTDEDTYIIDGSVFFIDTNCKSILTLRKACSLEAATLAYPRKNVYFLFSGDLLETEIYTPLLHELLKLTNFEVSRINYVYYARNTPFENQLEKRISPMSTTKAVEELLKLVTLYKYGGIIYDVNVIVTRNTKDLGSDWIVMADRKSPAIVAIEKDSERTKWIHVVLRSSVLQDAANIEEVINNDLWLAIIAKFSNKSHAHNLLYNGLKVYDHSIIEHLYEDSYYQEYNHTRSNSYASLLPRASHRRAICRGSRFNNLARTHCPMVYKKFISKFVQ